MAWRMRHGWIPRLAGLNARYELHMKEANFDERFESSPEYSSDYRVDDSFGSDNTGSVQTATELDAESAFDQSSDQSSGQGSGQAPDLGPCLYLGAAGQRCYRRAVKDGFCALHQPGAAAIRRVVKPAKWVAAIGGIVGVLWPYIYDFLHELFRIFHPR